jgi:hypothetical protein
VTTTTTATTTATTITITNILEMCKNKRVKETRR